MTASARHDERCGDAAAVDVAAELDRIAGREQAVRGGARAGGLAAADELRDRTRDDGRGEGGAAPARVAVEALDVVRVAEGDGPVPRRRTRLLR